MNETLNATLRATFDKGAPRSKIEGEERERKTKSFRKRKGERGREKERGRFLLDYSVSVWLHNPLRREKFLVRGIKHFAPRCEKSLRFFFRLSKIIIQNCEKSQTFSWSTRMVYACRTVGIDGFRQHRKLREHARLGLSSYAKKGSRKCFTSPFKVPSSRRGRRQWDRDVVPESRMTVVTLWERCDTRRENRNTFRAKRVRFTATRRGHPVCVQRKSYANPRENIVCGNYHFSHTSNSSF